MAGPNNSGKSTIVGAFRILHEGLRKARAKNPERVTVDGIAMQGYKINIDGLPVASENIFHDYDDSRTATIVFRLSNEIFCICIFPSVVFVFWWPSQKWRYSKSQSISKCLRH
ncbi:hypothetical protein [Cupriavidus sp. EM10]